MTRVCFVMEHTELYKGVGRECRYRRFYCCCCLGNICQRIACLGARDVWMSLIAFGVRKRSTNTAISEICWV